MLRGWFGYFKHATPVDLETLDGFIRRRLGHSCTSRKTSTLPSSALSSIINDGGITSLPKLGCSHYPQQLAERDIPPMRKLLTGEPYAGKPPLRFGREGSQSAFRTPIGSLLVRATVGIYLLRVLGRPLG